MDRLAEKQQRIENELLPLARKLMQDPKQTNDTVRWEIEHYARRTWLLSSSVARDYSLLVMDRMRNH